MAEIKTSDWIDAVKKAQALEAEGEKYPYSELEEELFSWCMTNIPDDAPVMKVLESSQAFCAEDYHALSEWLWDTLLAWPREERSTDDAHLVYNTLSDIAIKWRNLPEW